MTDAAADAATPPRAARRAEDDVHSAAAAAWRIEAARIIATLTRYTGDFGLAEDLAQDALADALHQWPTTGVPQNPAAWLTAVAKRKAIDEWRRRDRLTDRVQQLGHDLREHTDDEPLWDDGSIDDDVLRLVFIACHPSIGREARVALTLRTVAGLETEQIAHAFLVPTATVQQRIVRAKKTLGAAGIAFETPSRDEWSARLSAVLGVVYLIFTEGHTASAGDDLIRIDLAQEAMRLGRRLTALLPREPEAWGLLALMELTAARFPARTAADGAPVTLEHQDRRRWDRSAILRGRAALAKVDGFGRGRGAYALQASIAEQHDIASTFDQTDWTAIVGWYDALLQLTPSPIVALNRVVALSMRDGAAAGLALVDDLAADPRLATSHLVPTVRAELLSRLGRDDEAAAAYAAAAQLTQNARERAYLQAKAVTAQH